MAAIQDTAGIFTGDCLDAFNEMEAAVLASGDVSGTQARLIEVMLDVLAYKSVAIDPTNPSAEVELPR